MTGITNAQGGPDRLKLRVFSGTSAPSAPKENDIWVNTDIPIGGYKFSGVSHPTWSNGVSGYVYFTSTFTDAETYEFSTGISFTQNTKCGIYARLLQCWQYNGNEYTRKDAYIYHDKWCKFSDEWDGTLFYSGDQYTGVTGGWTGADSYSPNLTATLMSGTITISTANAVPMDGFSTLKFTGSGNGANSGGTYAAKCKIINEYGTELASVDFQSNGTYAVSIAALTGRNYVKFTANGSRGNNLDISKVWLE